MTRLIPLLTVKENKLVKTKLFQTYKYMGDPINAVNIFGKLQVDELVVLDISETFIEHETLSLLDKISERALMPITYGGHINNFVFAKKIFDLGFDRIIIRRGLSNSEMINNLISTYGSSSITAGFDVVKIRDNLYEINNKIMNLNEIENFFEIIVQMNYGQILLNYKEKDGTRTGLELDTLIELGIERLQIPIIIAGGCTSKKEAYDFMIDKPKISVAASSIFTLVPPNDAVLIRY